MLIRLHLLYMAHGYEDLYPAQGRIIKTINKKWLSVTTAITFIRNGENMTENKSGYSAVIWDFNGTILDDVDTGIRAVNMLLSERGLPSVGSKEAYREVFGFPIKSYYERLGFDFSVESYEELAPKWVALYLELVKEASLYDGVREALSLVRSCGVRQILLSATERTMLCAQLDELSLENEFDEVLGLGNIHAHSKVELAREWVRNAPKGRLLLVGDTVHDLDTARAIGADCLLVCCGHQPYDKLAATGAPVYPDALTAINDIFSHLF